MQRTKDYVRTIFPAEIIRQGYDKFLSLLPPVEKGKERYKSYNYSVTRGNERWHYDSVDEFLANYRGGFDSFKLYEGCGGIYYFDLSTIYPKDTQLSISAPTAKEIARVFDHFEAVADKHQLPAEDDAVAPTIFIGHGHSKLWRDLKDHLQDQHGYDVDAYETGARAGHAVRDVLEEMLDSSSFAILIMTAEDEMADGKFRARQNVIHEIGLFQGRLGFTRAIVLREEGTEDFSNLSGINEIRFSKNNIREVFGDVLATLRREFSTPDHPHAKAA
jgi:predicted nucleotide-binding protein